MKPRILIIGAGISGLAAGQKLKAQGYDVTILEASSKAGGRVYTDLNSKLGIPFDHGAFMFHGMQHNPLADIALAQNIELGFFDYFSKDFGKLHPRFSVEQLKNIYIQFEQLSEKAANYARQQKKDMSLFEALKIVFNPSDYPDLTELHYAWMEHFLTLYYGIDSKELSASHWNEDEVMLAGNHPFLVGGYKSIIDSLSANLSIKFNTQITEINYTQNKVIVKSDTERFQADAVIVTVSLGVLKNNAISFLPDLPENKTIAINNLKMACFNRIALKFPHVFWPKDACALHWIAKEYRTVSWFINYHLYTEQPILTGVVAGDVAKHLEELDDGAVVEKAMEALRYLYGKDIPLPTAHIITRWGKNPLTLGSFSCIPVGASGKDFESLAQSVDNKLFFAGEATSKEFFATTHGAYFAGMREAEKIIKNFG